MFNEMRLKGILLVAVAFSFTMVACGNQGKNNNTNTTETNSNKIENNMTTTTTKKTINLTRAEFLTKVANFEETPDKWVYLGDKPAIIDFYADWCGPCKMVGPIIEEISQDYKDNVVVGKLDVDNNDETTSKYGIRNIPTAQAEELYYRTLSDAVPMNAVL